MRDITVHALRCAIVSFIVYSHIVYGSKSTSDLTRSLNFSQMMEIFINKIEDAEDKNKSNIML